MFKFARKALEKLHILQPKKIISRPKPKSRRHRSLAERYHTGSLPPPKSTPRTRVIDYILSLFSNASRTHVRYGVSYMTPEELEWTINADAEQIRGKAKIQRRDDNWDEVDHDGINPWWYK